MKDKKENYEDGKGIISFLILKDKINVIKKWGNLTHAELSTLIVNMQIVEEELRNIIKGGMQNVQPTL